MRICNGDPANDGFYSSFTNKPTDAYQITSDPGMVNPGGHLVGFESLDGYKRHSRSPAIGSGKSLSGNGGFDFWGNELYNGSADIGAYEK